MTALKVRSLASLREEMRAVGRGERPAPADGARMSFTSVEALAEFLDADNRRLLALIRRDNPCSIAELSPLTGRTISDLRRTLADFEAAGLVTWETVGRRRVPRAAADRITVEVELDADDDQLKVA